MVNLNEAVNRSSGVTVYSPTRRLNQRGASANAGTASRILGGTQPRTPAPGLPNGPVRMGQPATPPPVPAMPGAAAPWSVTDAYNRALATTPTQGGGGPSGLFGEIASPLGWVVGHGLDLLARPGRAVTSTINEVADAFNGGDASFGDWWDQFNDPSFGFGTVVGDVTSNRWANRAIGFVGDVLTDPLTYVFGAGVLSRTGRLGRLEGAANAISKAGLGDDVGAGIGRLGISVLGDGERAALRNVGSQIKDAGYYFKMPFMEKYWRIPGSGLLEPAVSRTVARGRARLAETGIGTALRRSFTDEDLLPYVEKLITGRGPMSYAVAADAYLFRRAEKMGAALTKDALTSQATKTLGTLGRTFNSADVIEQAETVGNTALNAFFARAAKHYADVGGKQLDFTNYVTHLWTKEGRDWLLSNSPDAEAFLTLLKRQGFDPDDASQAAFRRTIIASPKPYEINGKTFNLPTATIREINAEFARNFPKAGFKLLEDDVATILGRYTEMLANDAGIIQGSRALANSKSALTRRLSSGGATAEDLDALLTGPASPALRRKIAAQMRANSGTADAIRKDLIDGTTPRIQGMLAAEMTRVTDGLPTLDQATKTQIADLIAQEADLTAGRAEFVEGMGPLVEKYADVAADLERRHAELDAQILDLKRRAAAGGDVAAEWERVSQEAADVAIDQQTVAQLWHVAAVHRARAARAEQVMSDDSLMSLLLDAEGRRVVDPQYAAPEAGEVRGLERSSTTRPPDRSPPASPPASSPTKARPGRRPPTHPRCVGPDDG